MVHCVSTRRLLLAPLALALTASTLAAQAEIVSVATVDGSPNSWPRDHLTKAHPDGGAVTALEFIATSPFEERIEVRRTSELGDEIWTFGIFLPQVLLDEAFRDLAVGPAGEVAVLWSVRASRTSEVVLLAPDGTERWREQIGSPQAGPASLPIDVEFDTAGNVYVTTFDDNLASAAPDELDVRMLAGGTGALLWAYRQPAASGSLANFAQARSSGGDLFVTWPGATPRVARLDPTGAEVYAAPVTLAGPLTTFAVDGSQSVLLSSLSSYVVLDATGAATPLTGAPAPPLIMESEGLPGGGFALRHGCCWVSRLDSGGVPLWTHLSDGIGDTYEDIVGESGGAIVVRGRSSGADPTTLEWLGALGAQVGGASVEGFDSAVNVLSPFVLDRRGNLWFSSRRVNVLGLSAPGAGGSVVKLAVGGEQGSLGCTQPFPNSTGAAGVLSARGASAAANDNLTLLARDLPPLEFTLFLNSRTAGLTPGVGLTQASLCLASPVNRYAGPNQIRLSSGAGTAALQLDLALTPEGQGVTSILAGETWHFQAWHRDPGAVGGAHLTNSIALTFD